jgi:UTP--glucose-1-phosphate uridylyltransferase
MTVGRVHTAVIPVAGLATRIQPIARSVPKEMLPLGDKPMLHHVVEELVNGGIQHIIFVLGTRSEAIERYFHYLPDLDGDWSAREANPVWSKILRCSFTFVRQERPSGVIDAVRKAYWNVGAGPYIVHMGDSIIHKDAGLIERMIACHDHNSADLTIGVSWHIPHPTSASGAVASTEQIGQEHNQPFHVKRFLGIAESDPLNNPYVIGRYLLEGPMPAVTVLPGQGARFGSLTSLIPNGDSASVMAVPLIGDEQLLGAGTTVEYAASWRRLLEAGV